VDKIKFLLDAGESMFQETTAQIAFSSSPLTLVTVSGIASTAGILGWRWWKQKNAYKSLHLLPSPPKHWLLGNTPLVLAAVKKKKLFQLLFDWSQELGPMYVFWTGQPALVLSQPWELSRGRSSLEQLQQNLLIYPSDGMPVRFRLRK
jgi:hypothetical protein